MTLSGTVRVRSVGHFGAGNLVISDKYYTIAFATRIKKSVVYIYLQLSKPLSTYA